MKKTALSRTRENGHESVDDAFKRQLLSALTVLKEGDFSVRLPSDLVGLDGKIADTFNEVAERKERFGKSLTRLQNEVGRKGKIGDRLEMGDATGAWADRIEAVNSIVDELSRPTVEMARVIGAVAKGDLTQSVPLEVEGRPLQGEY